jgi:uncharacterized RDD family membrane protein YckC
MLASCLDWILILGIAFFAMLAPLLRVLHQLQVVIQSSQYTSQSASYAALRNAMYAPSTFNTLLTFWLVGFGIALVYFWLLPAVLGATFGKLAFGLRIVNAADGSRVSVRAAGIRALLLLLGPAVFLLIPIPGGILWLADGLAVLRDPARGQSLHDRLAGTMVTRARGSDKPEPAPPSPW